MTQKTEGGSKPNGNTARWGEKDWPIGSTKKDKKRQQGHESTKRGKRETWAMKRLE